ncbi:hypothetical protein NDU88_004223 [Pleurodeles waltl]|uniref:Uncharacterized protein n=1 Tax=Pleurodeles waltl TaxID=8319 RepID=A0AAV7NLK9_PLEWA|nr:hypothetical protein NDU88_004223 [Pleurodeles waltl]
MHRPSPPQKQRHPNAVKYFLPSSILGAVGVAIRPCRPCGTVPEVQITAAAVSGPRTRDPHCRKMSWALARYPGALADLQLRTAESVGLAHRICVGKRHNSKVQVGPGAQPQ